MSTPLHEFRMLRWTLLFFENVSYLCLFTWVYCGFRYIQQTNFSKSSNNTSVHSCSWPSLSNVVTYTGPFSTRFNGLILPLLTNALVVSHPVKQCIAGSIEQMSSPLLSTMLLIRNSRRLLPIPVSNRTFRFISLTCLVSNTNTSVSGDLTTILVESGRLSQDVKAMKNHTGIRLLLTSE